MPRRHRPQLRPARRPGGWLCPSSCNAPPDGFAPRGERPEALNKEGSAIPTALSPQGGGWRLKIGRQRDATRRPFPAGELWPEAGGLRRYRARACAIRHMPILAFCAPLFNTFNYLNGEFPKKRPGSGGSEPRRPGAAAHTQGTKPPDTHGLAKRLLFAGRRGAAACTAPRKTGRARPAGVRLSNAGKRDKLNKLNF